MTKPAEIIRNQAQSIWPGAVVAERGKGHIKHQHPTDPNRFMFDTQTGAKWHYGAGPYDINSEIDTAWVASSGAWDWEVTANDFHSYIRDSVPVSYRYEDVATGHFIELTVTAIQWVNDEGQSESAASFSQVTPVINDDEITWNNIAPGWHVMVRAETARLAKWLTIDSLADLGAPTIGGTNIRLRFQFTYTRSSGLEIWADGQQWDEKNNTWFETTSAIEFRDATTQEPIFYIKQPIGNDDTGDPAPMSHRVRRLGVNFYAEVDTAWTWLQTAIFPVVLDATIDEQVAASADDAWEQDSSGTGYPGNSSYTAAAKVLRSVDYGAYQWGWMGARFQVDIAQGVTIDTAYASIYHMPSGLNDLYANLYFENVDNSAAFDASSGDVSQRTKTSSVSWTAIDVANNVFFNSPEAKTIVQTVVDRGSWAANNYMTFLVEAVTADCDIYISCYDEDTTEAPKLHIEYTAAAGDSIPYLSSLNKRRFQKLLVR